MTEIDKYRDEIPKEESFEDEQYRISEEASERKKKDRDDDYAPRPLIPANTIRFANGGKYWELKDKTHK